MVFYRKYRPQSLDELIGQELVKQTLLAAHASGKLAHAYLFCGPRGTGKTSTARILAKMVNCLDEKNAPCNKCELCTSITDGSNLDLIEIDAASNRGIEDIRSLRENIKLAPAKAKKKIYIIDEVHMLTNDAFNALLKTLEEPPSHVLFILATTDPQKIPQTILSRVQKLEFKLAKVEDILQDLKNIVSSEKIKIADEELLLVAQAAQGSFRDGEKLLDQLSSMGKIDRETLEKMLLGSSFDAIAQLIGSIAKKNTTDSLRALHEQQSLGVVAKDLNLSLLELLRQLILIQNDLGEELVKIDVGVQKFEILVNLSKEFTTADLIKTLDNLQESLEKGKFVPIAYLPLEVAVVKSCLETKDVNQQVLPSEHVQELKEEVLSVAPAIIVSETSNIEINDSLDLQKIEERWTYILETARSFNYSLEALLRSVKIARCEEKLVVIEVPYAFHQRMLEVPKSRDMLESILSDILSRPIRISTILAKRSVKREDVANIEVAADDELVRLASEIFSADAPN
ncbi:DNA polymerase III, subunit gamma and tau [Candidatus Daviesbacteria bacterium RIFCSPLOWO2_02_FULL_40_8]|uniref:DNA polymerase III subunit gamma/tau n=1 Tax=Candidatus Daviesbacteria bacterium RIFCSPLOWO2_01_FULL_40_24 TaxID=1797787 RepID=A0A1F5MJH6_9BACT|nr:MAG: DNA polymerase III, subunit gamma and tau [Candidatus Daviesbacteria bacterium RIFCSPHIGHO2_01_FULL_41_45]OGE35446.1 MAG: DNA polymerase III, subunit gamma and tau [Candidatus Daviesbacteria bacterium RIFCSPHIGHO2_02_FULL_41_14]OGE65536.1 MAG: DNA polymerase III, subunit gamma and tau [Candidatus Daviesbacteria bacterium RIFCSPLOWO2_01_FULL_40_24]OGE67098.1 MAG: DNA polymerase III, subunit gamma and tau [Candidatus Daviesbacteria bacterium RIFCSPLOWO2_02_FULL_40_8]